MEGEKLEVNIFKLYPQYNQQSDRRKQNIPVDLERRSCVNRMESTRPTLDLKLSQDINRTKDIFAPFLNTPQIQQPQFEHKSNTTFRQIVISALSPVVPVRRISSLPDNVEDGNYARAAGLIGLMVMNLPEDGRDLQDGWKQITTGEIPEHYKKGYQSAFSFFRGTFLEPLTRNTNPLGEKIYNLDKTLYDTTFGQKIMEFLKTDIEHSIKTKRSDINDNFVKAYKFAGTKLGKIMGRSLLRMTKLGVAALSILEIPAIYKAFTKRDSIKENVKAGSKQTTKSAMYVTSMISGIGIIGAILAKKGPAYSLLGMGIGSAIGGLISKGFNKLIGPN